jgi:hypothetical protein
MHEGMGHERNYRMKNKQQLKVQQAKYKLMML